MNQRMAAIALAGLSLLGTHPLWAADKVELTTRVSGVVESVLVKPGQRVKNGAVLLRLDRTILQARLEEATADHARAQADEADAKREQGRAQELYDRTVSSTSELEAAELRYARAQAALAAAELKAPFDGVVSAIPGGAGTVVVADCQPKPLIVLSR